MDELIPVSDQSSDVHFYPYFTDEEAESERGQWTCPVNGRGHLIPGGLTLVHSLIHYVTLQQEELLSHVASSKGQVYSPSKLKRRWRPELVLEQSSPNIRKRILGEYHKEEQQILWLSFSHLVVSNSLQPYELYSTRLLFPWDFPGKNTGVVAISFSKGSSWPSDQTHVSCISCIAGRWYTAEPPGLIKNSKRFCQIRFDELIQKYIWKNKSKWKSRNFWRRNLGSRSYWYQDNSKAIVFKIWWDWCRKKATGTKVRLETNPEI